MLHEIQNGVASATELLAAREAGLMAPPVELCIDARSVYDAVTAAVVKVPADKHLFLHVRKLREFLDSKQLHRLWWVDTRMMATDGMTKGSIDRSMIMDVARGVWKHEGQPAASWPKRQPTTRSSSSMQR